MGHEGEGAREGDGKRGGGKRGMEEGKGEAFGDGVSG
jgi:hypothetical protein